MMTEAGNWIFIKLFALVFTSNKSETIPYTLSKIGVTTMSKETKGNKEHKKKPIMSAKEKRAAKRDKKSHKNRVLLSE